MRARITLSDVAKAAGVSQMTVSRVVRGESVVAAGTRVRVRKIIKNLGYVPDKLSGPLAHARSNQVAVILPSLINNVFPQVLAGITSELKKADYNPVVGVSDYSLEKEESLLISMLSWRPAAIIATGLEHSEITRNILSEAPVPVVQMMDTCDAAIDMCVGLDHRAAAEALADHLIGKGYRQFGYLGWQSRDFAAGKRFQAFRDRLEIRGCNLVAPDVYTSPPDMPAGKTGMEVLLGQAPNTDVAVYSNDTAAMGGVFYCLENDIRIPDQMAVAGFSGLGMGQALMYPLTTIRTRRLEIGTTAARNVLKALSGVPVEKTIDLGFELVPGKSA